MVKYLGIDYLQIALSKRRTFLSQTLLTIPQHLEHVANYPHNGTLQDDTYRTLWIQKSFDRNFLTQQVEKVSVDMHELVKSVAEVELEKYEQETLFQGISFDLYDIIPSSSSGSPDIPCNSVGLELSGTANFQEVFETDIFKDHKLEEVITSNYLADTMKKLPSLKRLLSRLVPCPVSDPLLLKAQKPTELCMFRDVDELHLEITMGTNSSTFQEEFEKLKYIENEYRDMELEEILPPFIRNNHLKDVMEEAGKQVLQQAASYTDVEKLGPCLHDLIKTEINSSDRMQLIEKTDSESSSEILIEKTFIELNEIDDDDDDKLLKRAILDSPLTSCEGSAMVDCFIFEQLTLQPFELSPLSRSFMHLDENISDLKMMWEKDKYFDEIIALRLPEPKIEKKSQGQHEILKNAREYLCLKEESQLGSLELSLCWDAVWVTAKPVLQTSMLLGKPSFAMEDVSFGKNNLNEELEIFERYSREEMLENQPKCVDSIDSILPEECPRTTLNDTGKCDVIEQKMYPDLAHFDPLSDFLILRSSRPVTSVDQVTTKDLVQRVIRGQESKRAVTIAQIADAVPEAENNIVPIKISDDLSYLLKELEEVALSSMQTLKNSGGISATYSFHSLTPDITRFFLKQLTHHLKETGYDVTASENYKAAVIVHAIVGASDLLLNCCLESAIGFISAVQERYNSILKGQFQSVRQKLCDVKVSMHQKQLHHPKVVALCRELDGWFNKQTNNQIKILVLLKRGLHTLMECLEAALRMGNTIIPKIVTSCNPQYILQNLKDHNCLLIPCEHIIENFPWVQFSLVVEYEHQDDSPWEGICKSHNISWICMKLDHQIDRNYISAESTKNQITSNQVLRNDIKLIGSQSFLSDSELLHLLETRYNLQFLERDYTALTCGEKMYFSDIDIDERNCVLLYSLHEVSDESHVERITERVLALSLKYQHCWMIFMAIPNLGRYPLPSNVTNSLFKLEATLVNFASQAADFEIQVLVSFKLNDVAKLIWIICEECLPMTSEIDSPVHSWLSTEVFKVQYVWASIYLWREIKEYEDIVAEQCLMSFPCFSSHCAQLLLKKLSLQEIFSKSLSELLEIFPSVPVKVFKLASVAMVMPYLTADWERAFSYQNQTKSAGRSHLKEKVRNRLMMISIEGPLRDYLNKALVEWRMRKDRRLFRKELTVLETVFIDMKFSESGVCLPLNSADVMLTSKNNDRPVPFKWYCQQNLETLPSGFRGSENIFVEGKPNKNYSKLDSKTGDENSVESQGQNLTFHELADRSSCYVPVKNQNVDIAELAQRPSVCNNQPLDHCLNNRAFAFSDSQNSSCNSKAWRLRGKNMDYSQQNLFPQEKMHQKSIQHHQLSLDHDAPFTNGKIYKDDKERSKSDLSLLASFGEGCQYGKDVREVQGNSYIVDADEDEELLPLNQAKFKPNQYVKGKRQMAHQECIGDLTQRSYNMSVPYEREYVKRRAMIEPSSNLNISGDRYFENEYEEHHVLGYDKRVPDFKEMSIRNHVPEPFPTTRSVYMGDNLESGPFCRILSLQTECPQKQNRHIYNSSQTQHAYLLGQHENMKGACSKRNLTGYGNTVPHSYPDENESLPRNMKSLNRDFENNLSETTRKLLQSPFQFSSFANYITRPQQQRIRVGLAQPLRRITTETEERNGSEMQQSFWTNGDSPPMDLESNSQAPISDLLKHGNGQLKGINEKKSWNRQACVTAATPKQVRKLAYERVSGVKGGQTKLVFR